jgi:phosphoribosylformimino-5-aminoimidazole carboxamide ribotide isomerase
MVIYPAVDVRGGKCVRLYQGEFDKEKIYSNEPYEMAKKWESEGAEFLHVVDLDGAASGFPQNLETVKKIVETVKIPIQLGGGIRNMKSLERVLTLGVERAILGTTVVTNPVFIKEACGRFGPKVAAGIDARGDKVSISGWSETTELEVIDVAMKLKSLGVACIIYTDILSDGTLRGINFEAFRNLANCVNIPIIASGGVTTLEDIIRLKELEPIGIAGAIIGKALYEGLISLKEAIKAAKNG